MNSINNLISIKVDKVTKYLRKTLALDNVSLYFEGGKLHGVIGPEGAGKTTLMRTDLALFL